MSLERAKLAAGSAAAELIPPHATVGLGSGSTAERFIEALAKRVKEGLSLKAVTASSHRSAEVAAELGLPLKDFNDLVHIDITVDGSDEIDPQFRMIKGAGGAHVREKILASASREVVIIVDETKLVERLGKHKLPVEVVWFGAPATKANIESLGYRGSWRTDRDGSLFITDNGNLLYDIAFAALPDHPEEDHKTLTLLPGVVDTGFFFNLAKKLIIGYRDGRTETRVNT